MNSGKEIKSIEEIEEMIKKYSELRGTMDSLWCAFSDGIINALRWVINDNSGLII